MPSPPPSPSSGAALGDPAAGLLIGGPDRRLQRAPPVGRELGRPSGPLPALKKAAILSSARSTAIGPLPAAEKKKKSKRKQTMADRIDPGSRGGPGKKKSKKTMNRRIEISPPPPPSSGAELGALPDRRELLRLQRGPAGLVDSLRVVGGGQM